ncbi:hypothetical protein BU24DRAFT_494010 [Aaosphaeria arxii CBS 175.79]|uniref:LCCL domain-containing protein n=1 Tax=Aaosphaeria arxii CBS 175.79 TaxID=1450172 RepID=A0A6A5XL74_9PLEO|nr:uncharacterized protein BU24DRAFT_494010 [Aaosphaeria arxii CBS 175.79]KAF2013557.1 hypothetical protein BU24DRAFT_494010 [Aaosphaeria arxii CBS 175.79]
MAAPSTVNINNLDGKWVIETKISDPIDPVLSLQGISWLTRRAVTLATVHQHLSTTTDAESGARKITIEQFATGGLKGTTETRIFNWTYKDHSDWLFGDVRGKTRTNSLAAIRAENAGNPVLKEDAEYLVTGWLEENQGEGGVIESYVENDKAGWTGWQVWGFAEQEVAGKKERWFVRRFVVRKGDKAVRVRLCYSWEGELEK